MTTTTIRREGWWHDAACRGMDTDLFYGDTAAQTRTAQTVCTGCPVRRNCLDHALNIEPLGKAYGVWGGLTGEQRNQLRRSGRYQAARNCDQCGRAYMPSHADQRYCCPRCSAIARHARRRQEAAA